MKPKKYVYKVACPAVYNIELSFKILRPALAQVAALAEMGHGSQLILEERA